MPRDLKRLGHRVIGVDASSSLIAAARSSDPGGDYRCASATKLPLGNATCDLAIAFMTLQDVDVWPQRSARWAASLSPPALPASPLFIR